MGTQILVSWIPRIGTRSTAPRSATTGDPAGPFLLMCRRELGIMDKQTLF